jgi:5-methylcytosine-specific restriction endonuclease McrA
MLVHLLLSWRWIVTALRRTFSPARRRDTVNLVLNASLFITTAGVVVSGLLISRIALPKLGIATIDDRVWRETHNNWTDAMLACVAAHVAMNFRWIIRVAARHGSSSLARAPLSEQSAGRGSAVALLFGMCGAGIPTS